MEQARRRGEVVSWCRSLVLAGALAVILVAAGAAAWWPGGGDPAPAAAHKEWDFNTRVRVTNPANGDSVVVRINDRGPYIDGRCLDLSRGAFREIASLDAGVITVTYEVLSD